MRRSTTPAARAGPTTAEALVAQLGAAAGRSEGARARRGRAEQRASDELGGALDRTMAALEPYLMQLRLEMGAANA